MTILNDIAQCNSGTPLGGSFIAPSGFAATIATSVSDLLGTLESIAGTSIGTEIISDGAVALKQIVQLIANVSGTASSALKKINIQFVFKSVLEVVSQVTAILGPGSEVISEALTTLTKSLKVSYQFLYTIFVVNVFVTFNL